MTKDIPDAEMFRYDSVTPSALQNCFYSLQDSSYTVYKKCSVKSEFRPQSLRKCFVGQALLREP
jgi:hypothetical protein